MRAADFRTDVRQGVVWTELFELSTRRILGLTTAWARRFDGEPIVTPLAPGLPPDVPRLVIPSADGRWRIQVAPRRCDIFWETPPEQGDIPADEFVGEAVQAFAAYFEQVIDPEELRVTRMAYTTRRWAPSANPGHELAQYFCRAELQEADGPLNRPEDFQLHAHKRYDPGGLPQVNSWVRWVAARNPRTGQGAIVLSQDLNTLAEQEDTARYSYEDVHNFIDRAAREVDAILHTYLPEPRPVGGER